jgi:glycerol-3-phosphate acyltransferase PlsY
MMLLVWLCAAYLIGAIPTGVILTRLTGREDIRQAGSGNIGATNVYRVAGRTLGVVTLIGDCLKGLLPVLAAQQFLQLDTRSVALVALVTFLGHCYPIYLGFKGGKGVATSLGIFLVLSPLAVLVALIVFLLVLGLWRYISLASVSAAAVIPFLVLFFAGAPSLFISSLIMAALVIWKHKTNIERLRSGSENRFSP